MNATAAAKRGNPFRALPASVRVDADDGAAAPAAAEPTSLPSTPAATPDSGSASSDAPGADGGATPYVVPPPLTEEQRAACCQFLHPLVGATAVPVAFVVNNRAVLKAFDGPAGDDVTEAWVNFAHVMGWLKPDDLDPRWIAAFGLAGAYRGLVKASDSLPKEPFRLAPQKKAPEEPTP